MAGLSVRQAQEMINAAILDALSPENIALLARQILERMDSDQAVQLFHPGTVVADTWDGLQHTATLKMDGPPDVVTPDTFAYVLIPQLLYPGQRVMVWYDKPHVAYVIGTITLPVPPGARLSHCDQSSPFVFTDDDDEELDFSCSEELTSGFFRNGARLIAPQTGLYSATGNGTYFFDSPPTPPASATLSIQRSGGPGGFPQVGYVATTFADGNLSITGLRIPLRAGDEIWLQMTTVGTDSAGTWLVAFFEVSLLGPFVDQAGCQCSGG